MSKKFMLLALLLMFLIIGMYQTNNVEAGFEEVDYEDATRF